MGLNLPTKITLFPAHDLSLSHPMAKGTKADRSPAAKWALICTFFLLFSLHCLAIYLFTRGFLLTRTELSSYSSCSDLSLSPCSFFRLNSSLEDESNRCWTRPAVDRLVIIVLDALRFDFVAPSTFFEERKLWMDKLQVMQNLASTEISSARIFKAIADPPTTSLQRLKALTMGGLPTFIDVGNSFGAPEIKEDNWIYQLVKNEKRVLMMGDDTWVQLFPEHFNKSFPYPSFNVKDLDTVDNGVIEHLLPSLYKDDWDVLIAHFLGVDHAGHIFGVDSIPMIQKLEQYNSILESVIDVLKSQSGKGGIHENTLLIVMGDHAQTLNGDHGGGTSEEVETSLFAWSPRSPPSSVTSLFDKSMCGLNLDGEKVCISTMQQLDFAVTVSALLGIPFPFGSIGQVNRELYALSPGSWDPQRMGSNFCKFESDFDLWLQNYAKVLCLNSWQVKRYMDLYSATSVMGFPTEDSHYITNLYEQSQAEWSNSENTPCSSDNNNKRSRLERQIELYSDFLKSVGRLARSAWTEFDLTFMWIGLGILVISILTHIFSIVRVHQQSEKSSVFYRFLFAFVLMAIRALSFLSNSYILAEGRVASFLLATTAIVSTWHSLSNGKFRINEIVFLLLIISIRLGIEIGTSKQAVTNPFLKYDSGLNLNTESNYFWKLLSDIFPTISLFLLASLSYKYINRSTTGWKYMKFLIITGILLSYIFISIYWAFETIFISSLAPRLVYAIGFGSFILCIIYRIFGINNKVNDNERLNNLTNAMVFAWNPTILILLGKQGPFITLIFMLAVWCITRSQSKIIDPVSITQYSLLSVCLFYQTGHWCTFDGLRYGAAFIGFDQFNIIRQGILLFIDTFGFSHILPILSLPFLLTKSQYDISKKDKVKTVNFLNLTQLFLLYGLITAITTTFTIICVIIQRRHLMVWGLFAPKYVFDAIGLLLTDGLICFASLYYF